jgi:hypothetical protein
LFVRGRPLPLRGARTYGRGGAESNERTLSDVHGCLRHSAEFFQAQATFTDADLAFAESLFVPRTLHNGEFLQCAGDVSQFVAFRDI